MSSLQDERGYNQIFIQTPAAKIRKTRRCDYMLQKMEGFLTQESTILEIGCGTGEGLNYLAEKTACSCVGIDLSEKFIAEAVGLYQREKLQFSIGDIRNPQTFEGLIPPSKFDFIVGNGILHHLYYCLDESLEIIRGLLSENGQIIFIEPNLYNPYVACIFKNSYLRKKTFLEPDEMAFTPKFIRRELEKASFSAYHTEVKDFLLPIIPERLIKPVIYVGNFLEKTPFTWIAQSIFITAKK